MFDPSFNSKRPYFGWFIVKKTGQNSYIYTVQYMFFGSQDIFIDRLAVKKMNPRGAQSVSIYRGPEKRPLGQSLQRKLEREMERMEESPLMNIVQLNSLYLRTCQTPAAPNHLFLSL